MTVITHISNLSLLITPTYFFDGYDSYFPTIILILPFLHYCLSLLILSCIHSSSETVKLIDLLDAAKDRMKESLQARADEGKCPLKVRTYGHSHVFYQQRTDTDYISFRF